MSGCAANKANEVKNYGATTATTDARATVSADAQVNSAFPPIVQQAIRDELRDPNSKLTKEDLGRVEYIRLEGNNEAVDLTSLTQLVNLRSVELSYFKVTSYNFLQDLPNLSALVLYGVRASELPDFSRLKLRSLELHDGDIKSLDFLSKSVGLTSLTVFKNQIENLDGIRNVSNLKVLQLSYNPISDISIVRAFKNLERLEIRSTKIADISMLSESKNLIFLDIRDTGIKSISAVATLSNLQIVLASKEKIIDLDKLPHTVKVSEENILAY
jgi:Leucine-rich repeat (LRR) protein